MDPQIVRFIRHHHVFTLSTLSEAGSWTSHCFYAVMPDKQSIVFTTDPETRHGREMLKNSSVSGGIVLETKVIGKIRGVQFTGRSFLLTPAEPVEGVDNTSSEAKEPGARSAYIKRFPFALAAKLDLWILYIDYAKMTDNRLGFGKKLEWRREKI